MQRIGIEATVPGMVLAKTLFNERGDVLLRAGVQLTSGYIEMVQSKGFASLFVQDGPDERIPADIVSERVRQNAYRQVRSIFEVSAIAMGEIEGLTPEERFTVLTTGKSAKIMRDPRFFKPFLDSIDALIKDVVNAPLLMVLNTLRSYDSYTFSHCVDSTIVAVMLGKQLGVTTKTLRQLAIGCILHDIGKLCVPLEVLNRPGKLDNEDWRIIRQHPEWGYEFLRQTALNDLDLLPKHVPLQHHERQDGTGYPRGLTGTNQIHLRGATPEGQILLIAEVASVADVYDALRSDRPYRPGIAPEEVIALLQQMAGPHLNRAVVDALLTVVPRFPAGSNIVLGSGAYRGYRGVVVETRSSALARPRVRLIANPDGESISPIMLDLSEHPSLDFASEAIASTAVERQRQLVAS